MATLTFGKLWLNPASNLAAGLALKSQSLEHDPAVFVDVRPYAGGNFRMVTTPGKQRSVKVVANFCTDAQVAQLKTWQGTLLCLRDGRGEKLYGVYTDPTFAPRTMPNSWVVGFTFTEISFSETV